MKFVRHWSSNRKSQSFGVPTLYSLCLLHLQIYMIIFKNNNTKLKKEMCYTSFVAARGEGCGLYIDELIEHGRLMIKSSEFY